MAALHSTLLGCIARPTGVFVAALAFTTVPAEAQEVNACYVRTVGAVYLVGLPNTPSTCLDASHLPVLLGRLADGSVTTVKLADGAVITIKLADGAVTIAKLSFDPVTQAELDALSVPGTINNSTNPVDWTKLKGVPADFADGTDAGGGGTSITVGAGLVASPNPITTTGTVSVRFAGPGTADSVARSDHNHDHGGLSGLTDDDHPQYVPVSGVRTGSTGFAVSGTLTGSGVPPVSGSGVRMMFWPAQAAFRIGQVGGTQWDALSVGQVSIAMGENTTASGTNSTAVGYGTAASGEGSTAIGSLTAASGLYSTAMGRNTTASGEASTAMGDGAAASQLASTAMGDRATASGNYATAMGQFTTASGEASTAMGNNTTASGTYSTAMGHNASSNGQAGSFVYGDNSSGNVTATAANQFVVRAAFSFGQAPTSPRAATSLRDRARSTARPAGDSRRASSHWTVRRC